MSSLYEQAVENVHERINSTTSFCDRPSSFWIDEMVNDEYEQLVADCQHDTTHGVCSLCEKEIDRTADEQFELKGDR